MVDVLVLDEFVAVLLDIDVNILAGVGIVEVYPALIVVDFAFTVRCGVEDVPSDMVVGVFIDVLSDVNATVWAAVMAAFKFDMSVPLEESVLLCRTPRIC